MACWNAAAFGMQHAEHVLGLGQILFGSLIVPLDGEGDIPLQSGLAVLMEVAEIVLSLRNARIAAFEYRAAASTG